MTEDEQVKHQIHRRLRVMGAAYAAATLVGLVFAIWVQRGAVFVGVAIAAVGVVVFYISTERNAKRDG